ncbi:hypothetical protein J2S04_002326 [Alicyclobacillus tengchongensis]|uniref:Uncharacterized protein n=1 Tax=Alicyclobacillus tolerans TaxID=90970 RepID=A0ABT9LYK2_9BACL|nr:hypothetical protein [Alicyclobacillus tengchongensis]
MRKMSMPWMLLGLTLVVSFATHILPLTPGSPPFL